METTQFHTFEGTFVKTKVHKFEFEDGPFNKITVDRIPGYGITNLKVSGEFESLEILIGNVKFEKFWNLPGFTCYLQNHIEPCLEHMLMEFKVHHTGSVEVSYDYVKLLNYDKETSKQNQQAQYPDIVVIVTGKGPLRNMYEQRIKQLSLKRIHIRTLWLAASDYPLLVGAADLGVCLHFSTSGLDLPMKVVDMFGAGTPVAAIKYSCLHELVKHDYNGYVFTSSEELSKQLLTMFQGFPNNPFLHENNRLQEGVKTFQNIRWQDNWDKYAASIFRK